VRHEQTVRVQCERNAAALMKDQITTSTAPNCRCCVIGGENRHLGHRYVTKMLGWQPWTVSRGWHVHVNNSTMAAVQDNIANERETCQ